ncbi:MAG: hypothetical protein IT306_26405 [Chloroflexi bacterium]|nr:hypothetical protein [Chloroflexota bacterium]
MLPLVLTLALFAFWLLTGFGAITALHTQRNTVQSLLLAPSVGVCLIVLPTFWLSRASLPVSSFSVVLGIGLLLLSAFACWHSCRLRSVARLRPPVRAYLPFVVVFVGALILTGRPLFNFDFDWVSYANDDMANYVLDAQRLEDFGWLRPPDVTTITDGRDYSQLYWYFALEGSRPGSQLILAWVMSLTGLSGHEAFMPVILALDLVLISAAGGLMLQARRFRLAALLTCLLLSLSALNSLGVLYQLIAQVTGIGTLAATATLLLQPLTRRITAVVAIRQGILLAILAAGLLVLYPEITPFLGAAYVFYIAAMMVRSRSLAVSRMVLVETATTAGLGTVLLNTYLVSSIGYLLKQFGFATGDSNVLGVSDLVFPYYLVPSGLANLWGLQVLSELPGEPWLTTTIITGAMLTIAAICCSLLSTWRGHPVGPITLAMTLVAFQLFWKYNDFGLYKLAMFAQPFILGSLVVTWVSMNRNRLLQIIPLLLLGIIGIPAQYTYVEASKGSGLGFVSIVNASPGRINREFQDHLQRIDRSNDPQILLDTSNIVLAKFQSIYSRGIRTQFGSRNFFFTLMNVPISPIIGSNLVQSSVSLAQTLKSEQIIASFPWFIDSTDFSSEVLRIEGDPQEFTINTLGQSGPSISSCDYIVGTTRRVNFLNGRSFPGAPNESFFSEPCSSVHNFLIFVDSVLGRHYYNFNVRPEFVGINQLESDPLRNGRAFAGIGRRVLLQVMQPTSGPRLMIDLTATLKNDSDNRLPPALVIGSDRQPLPIVGRGSARVFSDPVMPASIADRNFIGLDMGIEGQRFPSHRAGVMALYGRDVRFDRRSLTAFVRDISLVSEEEYQELAPPSILTDFAKDLANADVEYSGLYEDGWISEAAFVGLTQPEVRVNVVARGEVPSIDNPDFSTELRLLVDGQEVARRVLKPGQFEIWAPVPSGSGRRRIELRFSEFQRLGGNDGRPVAALMHTIGFEPESTLAPPEAIRVIPADVENIALWTSGIDLDGWTTGSTFVDLAQSNPTSDVVLHGVVPQINDATFTTDLDVLVDGRAVLRQSLSVGTFELRAPLPPGEERRRIELRFTATQQLPDPDGRRTAARLQYIGIEPREPGVAQLAATPITVQPPASPPQIVQSPADLVLPSVNASGASSDGWVGQSTSFNLTQPSAPSSFVVRGMVPLVDDPGYTTQVRVLIDGQENARQTLGLGDFEVRAMPPPGAGTRHVELSFSTSQQLPVPDGRTVGARLSFVGFERDAQVTSPPR